jgi:hypothetical protein
MSALSSCLIADYLYKKNPDSEFMLCIEQGSHVRPSYYQIVDLLAAQNERFKKIVRVQVEFRIVSARYPMSYLRSISYYKSISKKVEVQLDLNDLGSDYQIWAPTTSRLWQFFKNKNTHLHVIEHGLGEYIFAGQQKGKTWKNRLSDFIGNLLGYPTLSCHSDIWLCSYAVLIKPSEKIIQINFADEFAEYVQRFWGAYRLLYPAASQELESITALVENHSGFNYIYLPGDEIRDERQEDFIRNQINYLKIASDVLFIVKNHPIDIKRPYWQLLKSFGECINIENELNCYMPVEFIAQILRVKNVMGSSSSALYYLKAWDPQINVLIYNDYDPNMLTDESKQLKALLASAGLISKIPNISAVSERRRH